MSTLEFHSVTSLDTTEVEIHVTFLQVLFFTKTLILHSVAIAQHFGLELNLGKSNEVKKKSES